MRWEIQRRWLMCERMLSVLISYDHEDIQIRWLRSRSQNVIVLEHFYIFIYMVDCALNVHLQCL